MSVIVTVGVTILNLRHLHRYLLQDKLNSYYKHIRFLIPNEKKTQYLSYNKI